MSIEDSFGSSMRAFFDAPENKNLFRNCPIRPELAHLHEMEPGQAECVVAHMLGHILDYKAGSPRRVGLFKTVTAISQDGIEAELRYLYNDLNNPAVGEARRKNINVDEDDKPEYRGFGPEQRGCFGADARAELMAEAFRAYLQNPNYIKTVAPNVATRICITVNPNPEINHTIQFN